MNNKLKRWEVALMVGVLCAVLFGGWIKREQQALADSVIRLHVIANSDSEEDQQLKLAVRDQVLAQAEDIYPEGADMAQAEQVLAQHLAELAQAGSKVVQDWNKSYPVTASLEECWFPTKEYGDFSMPAGTYKALRVVIGEGEGRNWWCVAFPPLCLGAASETLDNAVQVGHFTPDQAALVTEENEGYVFKFKAMELLGYLQKLLGGDKRSDMQKAVLG